MDWLRPGLLWGLAGAALPLLIHLVGRQRRRTVRLPTVRFLERAAAKASARMKLRQLLLMLARMAAVGLLASLFAGPGIVGENMSEARTVVLLVDTSPSMSASRGGPTRLEEARGNLARLLDESTEADRFAVVTTERGVLAGAQPFTDRLEARNRLLGLNISENDGGIPAALDLAATLLKERGSSSVVLATDLQKSAWRDAVSGAKLGLSIKFIDVGFEKPENSWIETIELSGGAARVKPASVGGVARYEVSFTTEKGATITSFLEMGGEAEFRPERTAEPSKKVVKVAPGGDLAWDDAVTMVPSASGQVRLLLVNGDPRSSSIADELHFVRLALASGGRMEKNVEAVEVRQSELTLERVEGFDAVLLANPGPLSPELAEGLLKLAEKGVGVIISAGDRWVPEQADEGLELLVPARLRDRMLLSGDDASRPPFEEVAGDSSLPPFNPPQEAAPDRPARISGYWLMETSVERSGRVLARLGNQLPLLAERRVGKGRLLLFATTLDRDWSDFCLRPDFLPFLERLALYAAGRTAGALKPLVLPGEKVASPFAETVELTTPGGGASLWQPSELAEARATGFYGVTRQGRLAAGFYCRIDPRESDTTRITPAELSAITGGLGLEVREGAEVGRARRDLSSWLAVGILVALAFEAFLSARRGRRAQAPFDVEAKA